MTETVKKTVTVGGLTINSGTPVVALAERIRDLTAEIADLKARSCERMFNAAVQSLGEISNALGIPDDEAAVANGNDLILDAIQELKLAEPTDEMVDAACAAVPDLFRVDAARALMAAWKVSRGVMGTSNDQHKGGT